MLPFFSIIIPVYNVAPYLRVCLDSVLSQTFTDWEAICVDDGSTDGSGVILDEYAARDTRFCVIHQPNAGVSAARNKALDHVRGEWICFLDGDDIWHDRFLHVFVTGIRQYPNDVCFRVGFEQFKDEPVRPVFNEIQYRFEKIDISKTISMREFYSFFFFCYTYKHELFDGVRFPGYIRGEDRCVLNRLQLQRINAIVKTDAGLYGYRQRRGSAMNKFPSVQVLRDEMDHRLDLMEMIDGSVKKVERKEYYSLEVYFTRRFYDIISVRNEDKDEVISDWRKRLVRLCKVKGLSLYGRFVACTCSRFHFKVWDALVCKVIPNIVNICSPLRYIRYILRKINNGR